MGQLATAARPLDLNQDELTPMLYILSQRRKITLADQGSEDFDSFADDLLAERSARPLVIVGASKVEALLVEVLKRFLLPKNVKSGEPDELFENNGPLQSLSSRIKMCHRLGLIDETLYKALEKLRTIRNLCAHKVKFDESRAPVSDHFRDLRTYMNQRESYRLTRGRYFGNSPLSSIEEWQCILLTFCVLIESVRRQTKRTPHNKKTARIAAR